MRTEERAVSRSQVARRGFALGNRDLWGNTVHRVLDGTHMQWANQAHHFRMFCYRESEGPREVCGRIRALCLKWLKPEKHTKAQIVDLVILEQFLKVLPHEMGGWVRGQQPENSTQAEALAEHFLLKQAEGAQVAPDLATQAPEAEKDPPNPRRSLRFSGVAQEEDPSATLPGRHFHGFPPLGLFLSNTSEIRLETLRKGDLSNPEAEVNLPEVI
ncbi:zinc finger protein 397-like, partial [Sceloporus undulatus]|uniref:zinc finger protein 397-like n=1 Tax=Sceloporus undulatus TaxID=8520 RepID=UPI001C4DC0D9